jgi:hypothetical protein
MNSTNKNSRLRTTIGLGMFAFATGGLLVVIAYLSSIRLFIGRQITELEKQRDELQAVADRMQKDDDQIRSDKRVLLDLLRHCRTAEDIPAMGGERIVTTHCGDDVMRFYVPEGSHAFELTSTWQPAVDTSDSPIAIPAGDKTWTVPLLPASGYCFAVKSDRESGPIEWELTGNHPEFDTQTGAVPLVAFSNRSSSWSGSGTVLFPNQLQHFSTLDLENAAKVVSGIEILRSSLSGPNDGVQYDVTFHARIISAGRACISASDAQREISLGQEKLLMPYEGSGKYDIRPAIE